LPVIGLIFVQPDLGSALVVLSIFISSILFSKISFKQFTTLLLSALLLIPLFWFFLHDYQRMRVVHFLNPYFDPLGEGYNLIQSKIAVGSGGFLGRGLGRGTQSHLAFLPERYTDFIFASLAEELGFVGSLTLIVLYLILFLRMLKIASLSKERPYFLLAVSIFFYLFFQTIVNIAMNIGLMPITGITLPLVSYGGSSLVTTMISLGILENISRKNSPDVFLEIK
jgi:rod shape determining protein RodA